MEVPLNEAQARAVNAPEHPLLIVAGAGTGKTRVLTSRIVHLIEQGVKPERILAVTFTNKAAKEMLERVEGMLHPEISATSRRQDPWIGTFHAFGATILRKEAYRFGRTPGFIIFDTGDSFSLLKKLMKDRGMPLARSDKGTANSFMNIISSLKNGMLAREELENGSPKDRAALELFIAYEEGLRAHNAFDFDDLLVKVVELLGTHPEMAARYHFSFDHVLVDEYQDINRVQYDLVRLLAPHGRISVVGDAAQTIYTWRGSDIDIFLGFARDWPHAQIVHLGENYRSSGHIIAAASALIEGHGVSLLGPRGLWTKNKEGTSVTLFSADDEDEEASWIGDTIARDPAIKTAILYRTNAQSRALEQALIDRGIQYRIFGGLRFYERKEIKDIIAGVRYMLNEEDVISRERLEKCFGKRAFRALAPALRNNIPEKPHALITSFIERSNYFSLLEKNADRITERQENIAELIRFAESFEIAAAFLERIALLGATDEPKDVRSTQVELMTMHLAKGLEFDRVFVAGVSEGLLPHARSMAAKSELEEERRLLYVAMTRARKELFLSFWDIPSRFLSEIPEEHMTIIAPARHASSRDDIFGEEQYISFE